ncbi:hypothetical protein TH19_21540 [Thalassospira profundimaris]|uniref:Fe-containing alcohol dehydrogenase-like C-terminal domain-containing protein n=1 Tax=Thalassospira profundimaris TaxID=502049 RepID=A0A367W1B8_9PROT|nr:hypothetical protein TH19_21540 [Thalassospira profundimaris]
MLSAAAMGATAFQKGLGAVHALSHPIGAVYGTPHGMTNAIALPAVVKFNRPAIEARVELLAAYLGIEGGFDGFYAWLIDFSRALGVPEKNVGPWCGSRSDRPSGKNGGRRSKCWRQPDPADQRDHQKAL